MRPYHKRLEYLVHVAEGLLDGKCELRISVSVPICGQSTHRHICDGYQSVRASGIQSMPRNDHGDGIDVKAKGYRDRRNDAHSVMSLLLGPCR